MEREKEILYINTYTWNLEKKNGTDQLIWNRDTDVENKSSDTKEEGETMGWNGRLGLTYIHCTLMVFNFLKKTFMSVLGNAFTVLNTI